MNLPTLPVPAPPGVLRGRVMLVEDDQDHRPLLTLILQKAGAEVSVAENGKIAVEMACNARDAGHPFDLIVMDLQMPVLDGLSATRQLRAAGFTNPIIALTARVLSTDRERCLAAGCNAFLSKPVSRSELVRVLADQLDCSRVLTD